MLKNEKRVTFGNLEMGQIISGGIPKKAGLFLQVYDTEGQFLASGQMMGYTKRPAELTLTRRECDVDSWQFRWLKSNDTIYIDIPLSEIGAVQLEPGHYLEDDKIFYFKGKIRKFAVIKQGWSAERCVPLQFIKRLLGGENHVD